MAGKIGKAAAKITNYTVSYPRVRSGAGKVATGAIKRAAKIVLGNRRDRALQAKLR